MTKSGGPTRFGRPRAKKGAAREAALRAEIMELAANDVPIREIARSVGKSVAVVKRALDVGRQIDAFRLRVAGFTYREIADQTQPRNPHPNRAKRAVDKELAYLNDKAADDGEFLRRIHFARLEDLYSKLAPLLNGSKEELALRPGAVRAALRILQEQARMLRLYPQGDDLLERAVAQLIESLSGNSPALAAGFARLRDAMFERAIRRGDPRAAQQWAVLAGQHLPTRVAGPDGDDGSPLAGASAAGAAAPLPALAPTVLVLPMEDLSIFQEPPMQTPLAGADDAAQAAVAAPDTELAGEPPAPPAPPAQSPPPALITDDDDDDD